MKTYRSRLSRIRKALEKCEKEVRQIANEMEDKAQKCPDTTSGGIKASALNYKAFYLFGCADSIQEATTQCFYSPEETK